MKILNFYLILLMTIVISIIACTSENECDTTCPVGQVQLLNCLCATDASTIIPDPCVDTPECAPGQVKVHPGCNCVDLMSDPCEGVTCSDGFVCDGGACVSDGSGMTINVGGEITEDMTWTSGNVYILEDRVTVTSGAKLTIEAGVIVKGIAGTGANASALLIARGAQLMAMGTAAAPIIFTSSADGIQPGETVGTLEKDVSGLWGGIIILGNAPISASNDAGDITEVQIEGIPTSDPNGLYGGNDPADNSGVIQYISIRHGGTNIGEGNEINGLTLGGVGSGTIIENIEVLANQDDGIEFFGGTVSVTNALIWNCGDDSMDTDQAWNGTVNNFVIVTPTGGSAFELDGPEGSLEQGPAQFNNGTVFAGSDIDHLVDWDSGTNCGVSNVYIFGIDADYDATTAFETYGGDGTGVTGPFEFSAATGFDGATLIAAGAAGDVTQVATLANTVGANIESFSWTCAAQSGAIAMTFTDPMETIDVSGEITSNTTWTTGDTYILQDRVTVTNGATLTIQPGVIVKGVAGTGANASTLLIARGAQLMAMGTAQSPIIFTAESDNIQPGETVGSISSDVSGLWGGLIVLGNAPISASNDAGDVSEGQIEGIPTSDPNGLYGGSDPNDNSGVIRYVSIRHGGTNIGEGNEINGLTLGGVGSGTTIEHVEVVANQDDGIEFFGGTVDVNNALIWNSGDDSMDTDQAWNGTVDNFVIVTPVGGSAFELDGPEGALSQGPAQFVNGTVYAGSDIDHLIDWDNSTNCGVSDVYFFGISASYNAASGFESFGGDGTGTTGSIQFTAESGFDSATLLAAGTGVSEVGNLMNTVGADATTFAWTLASQSGGLASVGL